MALQWTPYHLPLVVSVGLAAVVAWLAWQRRERPGATPLAVFSAAAGCWTLAELGSLTAVGVDAKALWLTVELLFSAVVPAAWALIALEYAGKAEADGWRPLALLSIEPVAFVVTTLLARSLVFSAPSRVLAPGGYYVGNETLEAVFLAHVAYSYLLVLAATGLVVSASRRERELRSQGLTMGLAMVLLVGANAAWLLDLTPPGLDPTNLAFVGSALLLLLGIYRQRVLEVVPAMRSMARRQLFTDLPDAVVAVNDAGTVVDCNRTTEQVFDVRRDEVVGRPLAATFPVLVDPADELVRERDGQRRYYDVRSSSLGADGSDGRLFTLRDVTDRRRTEDRYRTLIARSLDLVTVLSPDGTITYESPSVTAVLGYDPDERVGELAHEYIHPEDRMRVLSALAAGDEHGAEDQVEFRIRAADGSWVWLEARGRNLVDDPNIEGVVVNSRDVTERKHREQQLDVLNRVLRHNLRNELSVSLLSAQRIEALTDDPVVAAEARAIADAGRNLADYASKAREAEQVIESRHGTLSLDLADLVGDAVEEARADDPDATFEVACSAAPSVRAHESFGVALANVLDNAVRHTDHDHPQVGIAVAADDEAGYVAVADDGPGIPEDELEAVLAGEETPLQHGSGIGLWLVNWLVDRSGGEVSFQRGGTTVFSTGESAPDGGVDSAPTDRARGLVDDPAPATSEGTTAGVDGSGTVVTISLPLDDTDD